jgi:hypothetical protein
MDVDSVDVRGAVFGGARFATCRGDWNVSQLYPLLRDAM